MNLFIYSTITSLSSSLSLRFLLLSALLSAVNLKKQFFVLICMYKMCFHRELKNFRKRDLLQEYEPASFKIKDFIFMILEKIFINIKNDQGHIS